MVKEEEKTERRELEDFEYVEAASGAWTRFVTGSSFADNPVINVIIPFQYTCIWTIHCIYRSSPRCSSDCQSTEGTFNPYFPATGFCPFLFGADPHLLIDIQRSQISVFKPLNSVSALC